MRLSETADTPPTGTPPRPATVTTSGVPEMSPDPTRPTGTPPVPVRVSTMREGVTGSKSRRLVFVNVAVT